MSALTDEEVLTLNNGKISIGDYAVVSKSKITILFTTQDVPKVNAVLEKNGADVPGYLNVSPILCSNSKQNTFIWTCNINPMPNTNEDYPTYRIKLVSSDSNTVVAYSNYFKVS